MLNNPKNVVEQFHLLFLDQLGRKLDKKLYALKGGCNLRFFFRSIRYSEDIDIDIHTIAVDTLTNKVNKILNSKPFEMILRFRNISIHSISLPKQTETTQRWKIQLKIPEQTLPINTKIEFSRRETSGNTLFDIIHSELIHEYQLQPLYINHYDGDTALQQKIAALAMRSQTQARDVFDTNLLINQGINVCTPTDDFLKFVPQAIENASTITFAEFKSQVVSYLLDDYQSQYDDEQMWENMLIATITVLENLSK